MNKISMNANLAQSLEKGLPGNHDLFALEPKKFTAFKNNGDDTYKEVLLEVLSYEK